MVSYTYSTEGIAPAQLSGFFVGWPDAPTPETHLQILQGSSRVVLALDSDSANLVGFVTAISENVTCFVDICREFRTERPGLKRNALVRELSALREQQLTFL